MDSDDPRGTQGPGGPDRRMTIRVVFAGLSMVAAAGVLLIWLLQVLGLAGLAVALNIVPQKLAESSIGITLGLARLGGPAAVLYFVLIAMAVYLSFAVLAWRDGRGLLKSLSMLARGKAVPAPAGGNGFFLVAELFLAVLLIDIVWEMLLWSMGSGITVPGGLASATQWELMFRLAEASVVEELLSRVFLIGVPLYIIHSSSGETGGRGLLSYLWGGGHRNTPTVVLLIFTSAMVFGFLHLGWQWTKVPPTVVSGFAFGYLYTRKGLHTAVLFHFAFDYLGILPAYLKYPVWYDTLYLLLIFFVFIAGPFILYVHTRRVLGYVKGELRRRDRAAWGRAAAVVCGAMLFTTGAGLGAAGAATIVDDDGAGGGEDVLARGFYHLSAGEYEAFPLGSMDAGDTLEVRIDNATGGAVLPLHIMSQWEYLGLQSETDESSLTCGGVLTGGADLTPLSRTTANGTPGMTHTFTGGEALGMIPMGDHWLVIHNNGSSQVLLELEVARVPDSDGGPDGGDDGEGGTQLFSLVCSGIVALTSMVLGLVVMVAAARFGRPGTPGVERKVRGGEVP